MVVSLAIALWLATGSYFHLSDPNQATPSSARLACGRKSIDVPLLKGQVIANSGEHLPVEAPESFCRALQEFRATL